MVHISFWGVIASPYQLKMQSLADFAGFEWERCPDQVSWWRAVSMRLRLNKAIKSKQVECHPARDSELDEYSSVPFYTLDSEQFYYDSTGLARHLDALNGRGESRLIPDDPELGFVAQLIDEAFDEYGLYMVHHNRWVLSATTTPMGEVTSREMRKLLPFGLRRAMARKLPRRQARRCPYLFSVAPEGFDAGVAADLTPPPREGFPPTHDILNRSWRRALNALEALLLQQPYLLGDRFTLADASVYGQLSMNLIDGVAADKLQELAPRTFQWLCDIRDGQHKQSVSGELYLSDALELLMAFVFETFVPLMQQNMAAHKEAKARGETVFNEEAFDAGLGLYDGELLGAPFRSVVKTFQVKVWWDLCKQWNVLEPQTKRSLEQQFTDFDGSVFRA